MQERHFLPHLHIGVYELHDEVWQRKNNEQRNYLITKAWKITHIGSRLCEAPGVKGDGGIAQSSSSSTDAALLQRKQSFFITNMHLLISVSEDAAAALDMASQAYKRRKGEFTSHIKKCVLTTNMMRLQLFQDVLHSHESY